MKDATSLFLIHTGAGLCPACRAGSLEEDLQVSVTSAEAQGSGWKLQGGGAFRSACPVCGMQVRAVESRIPIHCLGLECPKCHQPDELEVQVRKLDSAQNTFVFEALLQCKKCGRRNAWRTVLQKLSELLSIEIGLTGISLKAKPKKN